MKTMAGSRSSSPSSSMISVRRGLRKGSRGFAPPRQRCRGGVRAGPADGLVDPEALRAGPAVGQQRDRARSRPAVPVGVPAVHGEVVAQDDRPAPLDHHVGRPRVPSGARRRARWRWPRWPTGRRRTPRAGRGRAPPPTPRPGRGPGGSGPRRGPRCASPSSRSEPASSMLRSTSVVMTTTAASGPHGGVPGEQSHPARRRARPPARELLVGEGLQGRRVEGLPARCQRPVRRRRWRPGSSPSRWAPTPAPSARRRGSRSASIWNGSGGKGRPARKRRRTPVTSPSVSRRRAGGSTAEQLPDPDGQRSRRPPAARPGRAWRTGPSSG